VWSEFTGGVRNTNANQVNLKQSSSNFQSGSKAKTDLLTSKAKAYNL